MKFKYKNKKVSVDAKVCSFFERFVGLMFKSKKNARALLFDFGKPVKIGIHSFFVFFNFVAIWFDSKNNIIDFKVVRPFKFYVCPEKKFNKILEIPINKEYEDILESLEIFKK